MKAKALRIHGKMDLRLETIDLPDVGDDGILGEIVSDSVCMSSYKAAKQGPDHKRVPADCAENPTIIGHEFAGVILEVGERWKDQFKPGDKFGIQPALNYKGSLDAPGYSFTMLGGCATHTFFPFFVMEQDCLLKYEGEAFYMASLAEPMSCIIGTTKAQYHMKTGTYEHKMGIVEGGNCACLAGAGPMGLGMIDYLLHGPRRPGRIVVTDIDQARLDRAEELYTPGEAKRCGVELVYLNTKTGNPVQDLVNLTDGHGYDDVFVFAPVAPVVEQGDAILAYDGCLNFFAGPTDNQFSATLNLYDVHYSQTHIVGTSGGNTDDLKDAPRLAAEGKINPAAMVTHVGGITAAKETTLHLPDIPGGKKLLYTHVDMPLVAIEDLRDKGREEGNPLYTELADICDANNKLWSLEAERVLLDKAPKVEV